MSVAAAAAAVGELRMTAAELEQFRTQGWCIKKGVFDPIADFRPLEQVIDSVMDAAIDEQIAEGAMTEAEAYRGAPFDERLGLIQAANEAAGIAIGGQVYAAMSVGGQGDELLRLLRHPNLLSLVADLVGPDIIGSSVFRIRPKVPYYERGEVPFHQDSGYTMAHCDQTLVVTAWVPLVDARVENGCLWVLPWDFSEGIIPHKTGGKAGYLEITPQDLSDFALADGRRPVPMELDAGDVLLLHNLSPRECSNGWLGLLPRFSDRETVAANRRIVHQHHEQDALVLGPALQRPRRPEQRRRGSRVVHTRARAGDDGLLPSRGGFCRAGHAASGAGSPDARGVSGDPLAVAGGAFAGARLGADAKALEIDRCMTLLVQ